MLNLATRLAAAIVMYLLPASIVDMVLRGTVPDYASDIAPFFRTIIALFIVNMWWMFYINLANRGIIHKDNYEIASGIINGLQKKPFRFVTDELGILYMVEGKFNHANGEFLEVIDQYFQIPLSKFDMVNARRIREELNKWKEKHPTRTNRRIIPSLIVQ